MSKNNNKQKTVVPKLGLYKALESLSNEGIGKAIDFYTSDIPSNYLILNGQTVDRIDYPKLWDVCKDITGWGSTDTTLTLPDLRGRFVRMATDNNPLGTTQEDAIRNISGHFSIAGESNEGFFSSSNGVFNLINYATGSKERVKFENATTVDIARRVDLDISAQVPTADENRPVNVALIKAVKAKATFETEDLFFQDIADFEVLDSTTLVDTENFVLEGLKKVSLAELKASLDSSGT